MPDRKKEEESVEFKVVDRRLFTTDGQRRPDAPVEPPKAETLPAKPPKAEPPATSPQPEMPPPQPHGPVQFEHLIMSLVTTAMYQLGLAVRPGEVAPPPDLMAAQETVELLQILQQKTKGNLTHDEQRLLDNTVTELRFRYVQALEQINKRAKA